MKYYFLISFEYLNINIYTMDPVIYLIPGKHIEMNPFVREFLIVKIFFLVFAFILVFYLY